MLRYLRAGDILQVTSADRLARSTRDLLDIVQSLKDRGVQVEFLDNPALNTDTPQGEFMLTILAAVAQLVPETTLAYLKSPESAEVRAKIAAAENVVHY